MWPKTNIVSGDLTTDLFDDLHPSFVEGAIIWGTRAVSGAILLFTIIYIW